MSVLIKGMDMPKKCSGCVMWVNDPDLGMFCGATSSDIDMVTFCSCRLSNCPLVEVKAPHGDLIDRDALLFDNSAAFHDIDGYTNAAWEAVDNAPTVIGAGE